MTTAARIEELRKKFEENPRRYFAPLANELRKAGELEQAVALCREHLPRQPGHMSGYIVFGQSLFEQGELAEARAVFEQALALDPENLIALHHLGHIARRVGDMAGARRWYERALETDPRNDDIAHQLASLATPSRQLTPVDGNAFPPVSGSSATAMPTPTYPSLAVGLPAIPTPDAALRAVTFDDFQPTRAETAADVDLPDFAGSPSQEPNGLDMDGMTAPTPVMVPAVSPEPIDLTGALDEAPADPASEPLEVERLAKPVELREAAPAQAMADDPFGFDDDFDPFVPPAPLPGPLMSAENRDEVLLEFEEGLVAPEWPDTSELVARVTTPRSITPVSVDVPMEAVDAFGRGPTDPVAGVMPDPEPTVEDEITAGEAAEPQTAEAELDAMVERVDDRADNELPWLAPPVTPSETVDAIRHAMEDDARAVGEPDAVSVFAMPEPSEHFLEASFADVMMESEREAEAELDEASNADDDSDGAPTSPAFVTETMGELLVAQGFLDRAVEVYAELVRRRPFDPVLSSRLDELRALLAVPAAPVFTARHRFAALAARRVPRRTPVRAMTPIASPMVHSRGFTPVDATAVDDTPREDSLDALFGTDASPRDDAAAQWLAGAFAPVQGVEGALGGGLFDEPEMTPPVDDTTTAPPSAPTPPVANSAQADPDFSFERFFPDPAAASGQPGASALPEGRGAEGASPKAGDDLAQFSAWLKGLGTP
jgi:hypothetical protein